MDDNDFYSDEEYPAKIHFISPRIRDTENQRFHCMSQGLHLAIRLNGECCYQQIVLTQNVQLERVCSVNFL